MQIWVEVVGPGMTKKDFKILLEVNTLTIASDNVQNNENVKQVKYISRESSYQSFSRTFTLQKDVVDTENIQAKYQDGLLHLVIPKKEHRKAKAAHAHRGHVSL